MRLRLSTSFSFLVASRVSLTECIISSPRLNQNLLSRWEIVALLNVLHRFTESLHATEDFRRLWTERKTREREAALKAALGSTTPAGRSHQGQQPLPPHSYPATAPSSSNRSSPSSVPKAGALPIQVQIQDLGKTVYDVCKRSTIGCINILSSFGQTVVRTLFGDKDRRREGQQPSSGEL